VLRRSETARSWVAAVAVVVGAIDVMLKPTMTGVGAPKEGDQAWGVFRVTSGPCRPGRQMDCAYGSQIPVPPVGGKGPRWISLAKS
jgi:hypothetical protein